MWAMVRLGTLTVADAVAVVALHPHRTLLEHLSAPHAWVAAAGADGAAAELASAALWVAAAWLGVGLLCALAAALPGAGGRTAATLARAVLPRTAYRLVAGASGLGLLLTPVAAAADAPHPATTAPAWPTSNPLPPPAWPVAPPRAANRRASETPRAATARADQVVVERGDSLWTIAAEHLDGPRTPRRIAATWPRWYAANRRVIGAEPNHIVPGQILSAPTAEEGSR